MEQLQLKVHMLIFLRPNYRFCHHKEFWWLILAQDNLECHKTLFYSRLWSVCSIQNRTILLQCQSIYSRPVCSQVWYLYVWHSFAARTKVHQLFIGLFFLFFLQKISFLFLIIGINFLPGWTQARSKHTNHHRNMRTVSRY